MRALSKMLDRSSPSLSRITQLLMYSLATKIGRYVDDGSMNDGNTPDLSFK